MWKTLTVLAILLAGVGATFRYLSTEDAKLETELLNRSKANKEAMEGHLNDFQSAISSHNTKAGDTEGEAEAEAQKLETARKDKADKESKKTTLEGQLASKQAKLDDLNEQLKEIGSIEDAVEKSQALQIEMTTVQQELLNATETFKALVIARANTEKKIAGLKDKELMQKSGQMVALNTSVAQNFGPWGFVTINAGGLQGVTANSKLDVKRGADVIAKLEVTNIESNVSICDVLSVAEGQNIQPGDRVVLSEESKFDPNKKPATVVGPAVPAGAPAAGAPAPAPAPAPAASDDPFGLDPAPGAPPAPSGDDPFGLGADPAPTAPSAPAEADPFGLN